MGKRDQDRLLMAGISGVVWVVISLVTLLFALVRWIARKSTQAKVPRPVLEAEKQQTDWRTLAMPTPVDRTGLMLPPVTWRERAMPTMQWMVSDPQLAEHLVNARRAYLEQRDCDKARAAYQKVAYGKQRMTQHEIDHLTREVAEFAGNDSNYLWMFPLLMDLIRQHPGILQSDVIKSLPGERALASYVLYYAEVRGEMMRIKKGRSYQLYVPNDLPPQVPALADVDGSPP